MSITSNSVTLAEVLVEGYRSCRNTDFSPHPRLSALIGINGAGKTNLLSAIHLLANRSRRHFGVDPEQESSLNETVVTSWFLVDGLRIGYRIRLFLAVSSKNTDDVVAVSEEWNFHSITKSRIWRAIPRTVLLNSSRSEDARFVLDIRSGAVAKHQYASDAAVYRGNQVASFISS